ncbi:MAG: hypothetical protein WAT39_17100, partial [Planctomycetota bacterium]
MTATNGPVMVTAQNGNAVDRWSRWSDRLNPILVREVQQAMKGRVFALTVWATLTISVVIAVATVQGYEPRGGAGRTAFDAGIATLMPLLLFVVPMQAFQSMRLELRGGIVEQLLLSALRPHRILFGKLQAAMVQFVLYVAVLSPLLATSYLLRGVDLPTIVLGLLFALLGCVTATAVAVSSAAQAVLPALQPLANLGTAFGLGMAAFGFVGFAGSGQYTNSLGWLMRSAEGPTVIAAITLGAIVATLLSLLVARSFLLHAFENKATAFRVFLFALPVLAFGWMYAFLDPTVHDEAFPVLVFLALLVAVVFGLFMFTEQKELSPRVRAHVPASALAGLVVAPFLPGRERGTACFCLYVALLAGVAWWLRPIAVPGATFRFGDDVERMTAATLAYALPYFGYGRWLRGRLPAGLPGNHLARFLLPGSLFLFMLLPVLFDLFLRGEVREWHPGHLLNPFWTIEHWALRASTWPDAQAWVIA